MWELSIDTADMQKSVEKSGLPKEWKRQALNCYYKNTGQFKKQLKKQWYSEETLNCAIIEAIQETRLCDNGGHNMFIDSNGDYKIWHEVEKNFESFIIYENKNKLMDSQYLKGLRVFNGVSNNIYNIVDVLYINSNSMAILLRSGAGYCQWVILNRAEYIKLYLGEEVTSSYSQELFVTKITLKILK